MVDSAGLLRRQMTPCDVTVARDQCPLPVLAQTLHRLITKKVNNNSGKRTRSKLKQNEMFLLINSF